MSIKDYKTIADAIKKVAETNTQNLYTEKGYTEAIQNVIEGLCKVFKKDNSNFKADMFYDYIYRPILK